MLKLTSVLLACLAAAPAFALEVTGVKPAGAKGAALADFSFGAVAVSSVSWRGGAVVMPATEVNGRTYSDIKLLNRAFYARIEACFRRGCVRPAKPPKDPSFKVLALKPLRSKVRVANAQVSFDGDLLVVAGVMASRREPGTFWVAFPPELSFSSPSFKSAVESGVIDAWVKRGKKSLK
jgi:hypothetical protein